MSTTEPLERLEAGRHMPVDTNGGARGSMRSDAQRMSQVSSMTGDTFRRSSIATSDQGHLSTQHSDAYQHHQQGNAVQFLRTLSLSRKEWDRLLSNTDLPPQSQSVSTHSHSNRELQPHNFRSVFGLPILHPRCRFIIIWHTVMLFLDLTYTAFVVPIGVGFNISDTAWTWGAVCDFLAGLVFMVDFFLAFHTGYIVSNNYRKLAVMDGKQIARYYFTRGTCLVDSLSTVAWLTQVILIILTLAGKEAHNIASQVQILRILRLGRMARLFASMFMSVNGGPLVSLLFGERKLNNAYIYFVQLLYTVLVLINFLGCLWYWVADREGIDETWITAFEPYITRYGNGDGTLDAQTVREKISKPNLYMTAIYWAAATVSTIGYGDVTSQTTVEEAVSLLVFLVGIMFFGVLIGSLTQLLQTANRDARKAQSYREKMNSVDNWIKRRHFPSSLNKRIREHYWAFWLRQEDEADENKLLQELPHKLQHDALWSMSKRALQSIPAFSKMPEEMRKLFAALVRPRKLAPGSEISIQGHHANKLFLLDYGKVVPVQHDVEGELQAPPYMFNADSILQEIHPKFSKNSRGFRSVTPCGVWEWSIPPFLALCKRHTGLAEHLFWEVLTHVKAAYNEDPDSYPEGYDVQLQEAETRLRQMKAGESPGDEDSPTKSAQQGNKDASFSGQSFNLGNNKSRASGLRRSSMPASTATYDGPKPGKTPFQDLENQKGHVTGRSLFKVPSSEGRPWPMESQNEQNRGPENQIRKNQRGEGVNPPTPADLAASLADIQHQLAELKSLVTNSL